MAEAHATVRGILRPERRVPPPSTISAAAQAFLSQPMPADLSPTPDADDKDAWRALLATRNDGLIEHFKVDLVACPASITEHMLTHATLYEVVPDNLVDDSADCALLFVHGGAFVIGGGMASAYASLKLARETGLRIFSIDYRMPPDHPFPAGLDDAVEAYRWLLGRYDARKLGVFGISAGGGLAASALLKARDLGLEMPAVNVLATPEVDLTESGDSFETNQAVDVVAVGRLTKLIELYADGHDLRDPYLSPLFGDFGKGFPSTLLTCGTRDIFLSNTVMLHRALRRAGMRADLQVWEAMPHGGFFGTPEDDELLAVHAEFLREGLKA